MRRSLPILLGLVLSLPGPALGQFAPPPVPGAVAPAGAGATALAEALPQLKARRDALIERERIAIEAAPEGAETVAERERLAAQLVEMETALGIEQWVAQTLDTARSVFEQAAHDGAVQILPADRMAEPLPAQMLGAAFLFDAPTGQPDESRQVAAQEIVIRLGTTPTGSQALIWSHAQGFGYVRSGILRVFGNEESYRQ